MKVLDLFSGIGGFSLGLERAGMQTTAFCELDKDCQKVLTKHWKNVPIFKDVTKLTAKDVGEIDLICGGFPCQDVSVAGKIRGLTDENGKKTRSGLWFEYKRLIKEIKPKYVLIENVPNLRNKGLVTVLQDLYEVGYDAEWHIISASSVGAAHLRERIWIIAYPMCVGRYKSERFTKEIQSNRYEGLQRKENEKSCMPESLHSYYENTVSSAEFNVPFEIKPTIYREDNGLSLRLDKNRIKQLGNSIVPQIAELLGRAILKRSFEENIERAA